MENETWDQRVARERMEEEAEVAAFVAKLENLDLPGWTFEKNVAHFRHTESGAAFFVTMPGRYASRHGKVKAIAVWPKDEKGKRMGADDWGIIRYSEPDTFRIGFSYSKSAKAIAKDLQSRLIPRILRAMIIINEKIADRRESFDQIDRDTTEVLVAFNKSRVVDKSYFAANVQFKGGTARVSRSHGDSGENGVDLSLNDLAISEAVAIAKLLRNLRK